MVSTWKPILAALVIFAAGVLTGGLTVNLRRPVPAGPLRLPLRDSVKAGLSQRVDGQLQDLSNRMKRHLGLTPAQRERIEAIVHESQGRMKALWEETAPKTREEFRAMREKIRAELTSDQRKRFEELFNERNESRRRPPKPSQSPSAAPPVQD